jgi:hypothetical protein
MLGKDFATEEPIVTRVVVSGRRGEMEPER